jgi:hypothetical protein
LRAVIGVPLEKQVHLLTKANEEHWSVKVLQAKAQNLREGRARGGRPARSALGKHLRALARCLHECDGEFAGVRSGELLELQPEELEQSSQLLERMKASVDELFHAVEAQRSQLMHG